MKHGRYEILQPLGEGESAVVHRARDLAKGGREVALKVLKGKGDGDVARFRREFEVLAGLRHPNLITVLDFGISNDGQLYYSSEYHAGQRTFREAILARQSELSIEERIEHVVAILRALEYVHTRGVVHRDLKPGNLLVNGGEGDDGLVVRLSDFGLAGAAEGLAAGTPHYMAPEVIRRLRVDRRCDLYSLGVILYELLGGRPPYEGTPQQVAKKHLDDRPQPLRELEPEIPAALEGVVLKLLEKEPAHRYPSANAVIAALSEALGREYPFETSETKEAYVLSGKFVGRDREIDWLGEGFQRATGPLDWNRDPRMFDRRARFNIQRGAERGERRRGGDRRAAAPDEGENAPALMVFLRGESGVGKSRLLDELRRRCQLDGAVFLQGACRKHLARGYEPFVSVFQEAAQLEGAENELSEYGWAVSQLLAQTEGEPGDEVKGVERLRLVDALAEFLIAQSSRRPLVLSLENLQWARGETLELLQHIYRTHVAILAGASTEHAAGEGPKLFIVCSYRPEETHGPDLGRVLRELRHDRFFEELVLQPLQEDDSSELIRSMLGVPTVPRAFVGRVMQETRGNPLFVELLMEELVERGVVDRSRGLWRLDPDRLQAVDVPSRVHDLVLSRLERLPHRGLLEWLAVVDRGVTPGLLARIAQTDEHSVAGRLEELCGRHLLDRVGARFELAHSRVRDAIYEAIEDKPSRHGIVARALEESFSLGEGVTQSELAHHLLEAGAGVEAIRWARRAADRAGALGATERACELYTRALRVADDHLALSQDQPARLRVLNEEKLGVLRSLVHELTLLDRIAEARLHTLEGLKVARELDDGQAEVAALAHLGSLNAQLKDGDDAKRYFFEALKKAERLEYGKGIGKSLLGLGDLTLEEGRLDEALTYLERSLHFEKDLGDGREISSYMRALANTLKQQGRYDEAIGYLERALEQDQQNGSRRSRVATLELLADLLFLSQEYERSIEASEQAIAAAVQEEDKQAVARCLLALGSAHERLGQRAEARRRLNEALTLTRRLGLGLELAQVLNSVGWMHHQSGDYEEALTAFNEATTLWNTHGDREGYALGLINLGLCYARRGELVRAAGCYDAGIRVSWEISSRSAELEATWGRATVHEAAGEIERARELLDKTVLKAREQKQPRLEALALADLARLLASEGEGSRGLRAARRARALAREVRDEPLTARIALRAAEVDLLRGALAPAVDAFRLRSTWLRRSDDRVLGIEAELACGRALLHVGDHEGAQAAIAAAQAEAEARGLRPLRVAALLAQAELSLEQALARGYRPGRLIVSSAELGQARATLQAAQTEAAACGATALSFHARLGQARIALLEGAGESAEAQIRLVLEEASEDLREVRRESAALLAELACARDPETVLVRADEVDAGSPRRALRMALIKGMACEQAGRSLEARSLLQEGAAALETLQQGLDSADRRALARSGLALALQASLDKVREEAKASTSARMAAAETGSADRIRLLTLLRSVREVHQPNSVDAQLRTLLDRALALFGAAQGLLVKIGPQGEQTVTKGRRAPGDDLSAEELEYSTSIASHVAEAGEILVLPDAKSDLDLGERPSVVDLQLRSLLAVPLRVEGRTEFVMVLEDRESAGRFSEEDRELAEAFCELAAFALERTRLREEAELKTSELDARRAEVERLRTALDDTVSSQSQELRAVKQELLARDYELGKQSSYGNIVGRSQPMLRVFKLLDKVASSDVPILIQGESGTGKELVARAVHFNGARKEKPFLSINVAALPESLLESELFGHVKGAFTGADADKVGLFEAAHEGTLFLDEVGDMSAAMQTKLLRVLQEGEVRPIGSSKARKVRVRIVSASNMDLRQLVDEGRFRADLFYRLNVVNVSLPALRERKEDIPLLVDHLLDRIAERSGEKRKSVDRRVVDHLIHFDWPGNIRELENELRRLVALSGLRITERDLSGHIRRKPTDRLELEIPAQEDGVSLKDKLAVIERRILVESLRANENNKTRTAKVLGLSRYGFLKKLDKYNLREGK